MSQLHFHIEATELLVDVVVVEFSMLRGVCRFRSLQRVTRVKGEGFGEFESFGLAVGELLHCIVMWCM